MNIHQRIMKEQYNENTSKKQMHIYGDNGHTKIIDVNNTNFLNARGLADEDLYLGKIVVL